MLAAPASALAQGDPIMPLADVRAGMHCTGRSVIHGTDVVSFDADVVDVVSGDAAARQPAILIRVSGPAVDATGVGPGFSGSPIYCPGPDGTPRNAGAVAYGIGEYGNKLALATPIESILAEPVDPPAGTRYAPRVMARAHPLATPLSFTGLSPAFGRLLQGAGARAGRVVYAAPAAPRGAAFPAVALQPGSAMAVGLSSGDVALGAIGTVTYVDGDKVWAFGHPDDSVGRRSLFLQDAYVYTVVNNPVGSGDLSTYKLAAPGRDIGTLTQDGVSGVAGRLGVLPERFPLTVFAQDLDTEQSQTTHVMVADESGIGQPTGVSGLSQVAPVTVAQLAYNALDGAPSRQSGDLCMRITLRESSKPLRFCNTYVGGPGGVAYAAGGPMVTDVSDAVSMLDSYRFGPLHVTGVQVFLHVRRDLRQAYLLSLQAPRVLRRGHTARLRLTARRVDGARLTRTVSFAVPRHAARGRRRLILAGSASDLGGSLGGALETILDLGDSSGSGASDDPGARSVAALRKEVSGLRRYDGVTALLRSAGATASSSGEDGGTRVYRDPVLRLSGAVSAVVRVR